ncbi:hypothetical protein PGT21_015083 [Puccinia graminis f. sp. tritici]|uniref:Uncharacterized protein n=1 Tax=Puccinia graminis f. sp. tritici TaxID=56615 RepID=A0A5B0Q3U6_PUCGR|nr:hypothetical protein PGTUg99_028577 [Puccinia graminis f. sp. tritici]KAA1116472.1 hypothetical protein PGT21_015083 [Puccinia graminis f. sp. tritici]
MVEVDIASHDLMTEETDWTEPKQETTSHTLSVPDPMRIKASSVNLRENSELIQYYLRFLKLRKEEFIRNYKPTDWELLSQEERLQIAIARIHREQDDTLAAQLLINETLREYKEYKREQKLRMSASTTTASTNPNTSAGAPNNHSAVDHIGNPEDTSVDELDELLNYPRDPTLPDRSQLRQDPGAPLPLEDRVRQLSMLQIKKKTAETTDSQITNASQNKTRDEAMDLDDPSTFSEDTPKRPNSPDIVALSKKERIRLLIKEHIAIWKKFELEKLSGATPELKTILHQAQDSQKALQKLITKEELEGYVKGWNPWDAKRELFPPPPKKEGKKKSSTSRKAQQYDDPRVWADVFEIGQAWRAAYRQRSRKALPP